MYALFIYLEQPHFINSHYYYYFKTIRHLITALKRDGKQERRYDTGRRRGVLYAKGRIKIGPINIQQIITKGHKSGKHSFSLSLSLFLSQFSITKKKIKIKIEEKEKSYIVPT